MGARISSGSESKQDFATPWDLFRACEKKFGPIGFDLAAHDRNTKHERFFSMKDDALKQDWHAIDDAQDPPLLWLNPPFADIGPWAKKCAAEHKLGAQILLLVPAAVGSNWFRDFVFPHAHVFALNGRVPFMPDKPTWGYPKDCMICHYGDWEQYGFGAAALLLHRFDVWSWKNDVTKKEKP
jgi:phage N-6-adenine-methyltransferase